MTAVSSIKTAFINIRAHDININIVLKNNSHMTENNVKPISKSQSLAYWMLVSKQYKERLETEFLRFAFDLHSIFFLSFQNTYLIQNSFFISKMIFSFLGSQIPDYFCIKKWLWQDETFAFEARLFQFFSKSLSVCFFQENEVHALAHSLALFSFQYRIEQFESRIHSQASAVVETLIDIPTLACKLDPVVVTKKGAEEAGDERKALLDHRARTHCHLARYQNSLHCKMRVSIGILKSWA